MAAPLPHMVCLTAQATALALARFGLAFWSEDRFLEGAAFLVLSVCWAFGGLCAEMDGLARYREYQRIRLIFVRYGYKERVLTLVARSRCQRDAALLAAREAGCHGPARSFFRARGYRWYHVLPDKIVANPFHFFTPTFLRTTFLPGRTARAQGLL